MPVGAKPACPARHERSSKERGPTARVLSSHLPDWGCAILKKGICNSPYAAWSGRAIVVACAAVFVSGCAASRPVLYPNAHLNSVGAAQAEQDIDECIALADASGAGAGKGADIAKKTAGAAAVGGASGAAVGAVRGKKVGRTAGAGAAGAGAAAMTRGLIKSSEPTQLEKRFVDQCLHERGYKTIGWK